MSTVLITSLPGPLMQQFTPLVQPHTTRTPRPRCPYFKMSASPDNPRLASNVLEVWLIQA
ncbi:uncharacterized protein PHACADRAFT_259795, partial [Phanerochaete carnosa HHB-10118-sp]